MDNSANVGNNDGDGDGRKDTACNSSSSSACSDYRLFDRKLSIHQIFGGGKAADVLLWKRWQASFSLVIVATVAWLVFEHSGLSFLLVCSDILLILIVLMFLHSNYAALRKNRQLESLPELELSEELVNSAAASVRVKINYVLLMAHDITLGKDFRHFFKVVGCLWLLSVIGSYFSFFTLAYIGTIFSITVPAVYDRYEDLVDRYCGIMHRQFSKHYKIVDESVISRFPRLSKDKDT